MSYAWSLPGPGAVATGTTVLERERQADRLYGHDIWLDTSAATIDGGDVDVDTRGDYRIAEGVEALRQALMRRIVTAPGEWKTLPDYGVGARLYVKKPNRRAIRDELVARIRSQLMEDPRVVSVETVDVTFSDGLLFIRVTVIPAGEPARNRGAPLVVSLEV